MRDSYVIVYNEGNDRTSYIEMIQRSENGNPDFLAQTVPTVVNATLFDTWDDAMEAIVGLREANKRYGVSIGMMFPMTINKKDVFKAKLKHGNR